MAYNFIDKKYIYEQLRVKKCHPKVGKEFYVEEFKKIVLEFYQLELVSLTEEAKQILNNEGEKFFKKMQEKYRSFKSRYDKIIVDTVRQFSSVFFFLKVKCLKLFSDNFS